MQGEGWRNLHSLSDEQIVQFQREGYLVFPALIPEERLTYYLQACHSLVSRGNQQETSKEWVDGAANADTSFNLLKDEEGKVIPGKLHKVQGAVLLAEELGELMQEDFLVEKVKDLMAVSSRPPSEIDCFGTKFFPLLPDGGTSVGWHQGNISPMLQLY